jgi:hypothetical protein
MYKVFILLTAILFGTIGRCQTNKTDKHRSFIPQGYNVLDSAFGNLNKDAYTDLLLILKSDTENMNPDTTRPVLVLAGTASGNFRLLARGDHAVLCANCGGVFGDPYQRIVIKNGFFSLEHYGGSGWRWTRVITFRYDPSTSIFRLHRDAGVSFHASEPNNQTSLVHQKKNYGKVTLNDYTYEEYD